MCKEEKE